MLASKKPKTAKKVAPDPTKEQVWTNDGNQKEEKTEETETKEKAANSTDHDGEITVPGSTVNLREEMRTDEPTTQIIESDDDEGSIRSLLSAGILPKDSKSRLNYVKKMLNRTKVKVLTEKDSARPMSAPGAKSLMVERKTPQRPQTAHNSRSQQQQKTALVSTTYSNPAFDGQTEQQENSNNYQQVNMTSYQAVEDYKEVAYIPYEFAQAMILRMCRDMDGIKVSHVDVMRNMEVHFRTMEEKKRQSYRELIEKIKSSHKNKVLQYRQIIAILQRKNNTTTENTDTIMNLELKNQRLEQEKEEILKRIGGSAQPLRESDISSFQEEKEVKIADDIKQTEKETTLEMEEKDQQEAMEDADLMIPERLDDDDSSEKLAEDPFISDDESITRPHDDDDDVIEDRSETNDIGKVDALIDDLTKKSDMERKHPERSVASKANKQRAAVMNPEELRKTKALLLVARKENKESKAKIQALERQVVVPPGTPGAPPGGGGGAEQKRLEKKIRDLEKKLETENKKVERNEKSATDTSEDLRQTKKELTTVEQKLKAQQAEVEKIKLAAEVGAVALQEVPELKVNIKTLEGENKELTDNYNTERILRKKYYNMVEDMKGKIRVYCRVRPLSNTEKENKNTYAVRAPDEYSIKIDGRRGVVKEFQFDQIFTEQHSQETVFEDTKLLIQSAVDGYNVCIFAYGQTGSGKTYTMIGDQGQKSPGIAPRAFKGIFELAAEQQKKFSIKISCYMLELYNDKLIDLLKSGKGEEQRLDIKKDKKEMVYVQGSVIREAESADELFDIFQAGSENRHIASTKMNAESSRSHLIIGIIIESTNLMTGAVTRGKLSLVDLAGSERGAKTGAGAEQLKEANSINKSLSALGDVISALSTEQSFVPFRNNKLTMLMQDSLGGNAKTLMFVNISPADYNTDESIISLTYASRVKLITNNATKNADSKEVAKLKQIIAKLKSGEAVDDYE